MCVRVTIIVVHAVMYGSWTTLQHAYDAYVIGFACE